MIQYNNISAQKISWLKSNKKLSQNNSNAIKTLLYPESINELEKIVKDLYSRHKKFDIIGWSSNTLFMPSYKTDYLICTKKLNKWEEKDNLIICNGGVSVSKLARECVKKGYKGYYGLIDLPGTIAAAVYGNCGCFDCSIIELLDHIVLLTPQGNLVKVTKHDLEPKYRSTSLKRKEIEGIIIQVVLRKEKGVPDEEMVKAENVKEERRRTQPNGINNLGSTFVLGKELSSKGHRFYWIMGNLRKCLRIKNEKTLLSIALTLIGGHKFTPYLFDLGRWMFYDTKSYDLLFKYEHFIKTLFPKAHLEIEVWK